MIVLPQTIKTKWVRNNKNYLISKGYNFTKIRDEIKINVLDLQNNSNKKVLCACDYCGKKFYGRYSVVNPSKKVKYKSELKTACSDCIKLKHEETCLEKYGVTHPAKTKEMQNKINNTCLKRYGVKYTGQIPNKKEKTKETCLKKYGYEYSLQSPIVRQKIKQTCLKKYGVECTLKNKEIRQKIELTNLKKYGVKCTWQSEDTKEKIKQINLKKYGVEYSLQSPIVKQKIKQTCLKKYGVEYISQSPIIREKINRTLYKNDSAPSSKQQRYICKLIGGIHNYPLDNCWLDITDLENKIDIEYDGSGHYLGVKLGKCTLEKAKWYDLKRDKFLKNNNWKIIRIKCETDKLLEDNKIIELINEAKNYLINSNHTWVNIDFDSKIFTC